MKMEQFQFHEIYKIFVVINEYMELKSCMGDETHRYYNTPNFIKIREIQECVGHLSITTANPFDLRNSICTVLQSQ